RQPACRLVPYATLFRSRSSVYALTGTLPVEAVQVTFTSVADTAAAASPLGALGDVASCRVAVLLWLHAPNATRAATPVHTAAARGSIARPIRADIYIRRSLEKPNQIQAQKANRGQEGALTKYTSGFP